MLGLLCALTISSKEVDVLENVGAAIKAGSAKELAQFFGGKVEIKIDGEEATYSKAQAEQVVRDFFKDHEPRSFQLIHSGKSREGAKYGIGKLETNGGASYRVYIYMKGEEGRKIVEQMRFEPN
jgi:hypothetical protein